MRLGAHGDRDRRQGNHQRRHEHNRRRRARVDLARPERQDEPLSRHGSVARRPPRRPLYVDARDRRDRCSALQDLARAAGRIRSAIANADRRGAGRRAVRGGDRAAAERDEGRRQGDRRRFGKVSHAEARRGRSRRHDARRTGGAEAGLHRGDPPGGAGPIHHRRQRLAIVRRRQRLRADGGEAREPAQPRRRSESIAASPSPAAIRTRWASARSSPCRSS